MTSNFTITTCDQQVFLQSVRLNGLLADNLNQTGGKITQPNQEIIRVVRQPDSTIVGGIAASAYYSSLEVEVLWVTEAYRGQQLATKLLAEVEAEAIALGCQLAHLTTYSFQAPGFYQKQGYQCCGEVTGFPDGVTLYLFKKALTHS